MIQVKKEFELSGHSTGIYCITQGLSEETFLTASGDSFIASWNMKERAPDKFSVKADGGCYSTFYNATQKLLLIGRVNGDIHIINTEERKEIKHYKLHKKGVFDFAWLDSKNLFISCGGDGILGLWDSETLELKRNIPLSDNKLRKIAVSEDESTIAVSSSNGYIYILETELFNTIETIDADSQGSCALEFHPTKPVLFSGGRDAHLKIWRDNSLLISIPAHQEIIYDIAFSPCTKYFATCSRDKSIKIWDANTSDFLIKLDKLSHAAHTRSVNALWWSQDLDILVSAGDDAKVMGWKITKE